MDNETVEKLIEIVREFVFLYDACHQDYKNAHRKTTVWESIGRELNQSGEAVKNKWKTIRDGYTKYRKLLKSTKGTNKKIVTYAWASQLSFLDNYNYPRGSSYVQEESGNSQHMPPTLLAPQVLPQEPPATSTASTSKSSLKSKRLLQIKRDELKRKKKFDVVDNLFLSYAHTFKQFPAREQVMVKLELAKLFSNIELQLLDSNTYETNFNYYASVTSPASSTVSAIENQIVSSPPTHSLNQDIKMEVKYLD